MGELALTCW